MAALSWSEGNALLRDVGGEKWLARRIEQERRARGWSQTDLSRELGNVGHALHQSAISKIEAPPKSGGRGISIGEAIGFAKVFDIPLGELLLPPETAAMVAFVKELAQGPELLRQKLGADQRYDDLVNRVADHLRADPTARDIWATQWKQQADRVAGRGGPTDDSITLTFLRDVANAAGEILEGPEQ